MTNSPTPDFPVVFRSEIKTVIGNHSKILPPSFNKVTESIAALARVVVGILDTGLVVAVAVPAPTAACCLRHSSKVSSDFGSRLISPTPGRSRDGLVSASDASTSWTSISTPPALPAPVAAWTLAKFADWIATVGLPGGVPFGGALNMTPAGGWQMNTTIRLLRKKETHGDK